jgi:hypothetical protein
MADREAHGYAHGARARRRRIGSGHRSHGNNRHQVIGAKAVEEPESQRRRYQQHGLNNTLRGR